MVQDEVGVVTPLAEEPASEAGALDPLQPVGGDDLVGIDVGSLERNGATLDDRNGLHERSSSGVANRPMIAVAAATTGETKCVRPPRPWRPSKFRLDVEAQRSPGLRISGFMPRHMEQLASRHSAPAALKISSRPSSSA